MSGSVRLHSSAPGGVCKGFGDFADNERRTMPDHYRPDAPDLMVESAREYIGWATWTFVRTMADNPHWYAVRQRAPRSGKGILHERLYLLIRDYHYLRRW